MLKTCYPLRFVSLFFWNSASTYNFVSINPYQIIYFSLSRCVPFVESSVLWSRNFSSFLLETISPLALLYLISLILCRRALFSYDSSISLSSKGRFESINILTLARNISSIFFSKTEAFCLLSISFSTKKNCSLFGMKENAEWKRWLKHSKIRISISKSLTARFLIHLPSWEN